MMTFYSLKLVDKFCSSVDILSKIDDPLDAFAVHFGGGSWGLIAVCLFAEHDGILYSFSDNSFKLLLWNLIGGVAITAWALGITAPMFFSLKLIGCLRVSEETERQGLDMEEHGEAAYPYEAYSTDENFNPRLRFPSKSSLVTRKKRGYKNEAADIEDEK